jgi:hypothetical protein
MIDWDKPDPAGDMAPGYAGPPAGFLETVEAAKQSYEASRLFTAPNLYRGKVGKQIVDALRTRGRTGFTGADGRKVAYGAGSLRSDYALNPTVGPRIWADVAAEQARDPSFLEGIGTPEQFETAVLAARRRDYDAANETLGRAEGFTGLSGELTGGLIGAMQDPIQLTALAATAALPAGRLGLGVIEKLFGGRVTLGFATKVASEALGNAAVNVVATVPTLPVGIERSAEIGVEMTARDVAIELGGAALAGGVLGAAPPIIGAGAKSVRQLARELRGLDRPLTPAEADALPVLEQAAADIGASPYVPTPEGDAVHTERLSEAVAALESDRPMNPAVFETPAPAVKEAAAPGFDPTPFLSAAEAYARDRKAGPLTTEALGAHLGLSRGQAQDVLSRLAGSERGRGLFRVSYNPKSGVAKFSRPMQRKGFVDLITQLADMGGVRPDGGHDLLNTLGQRFVGGAGPLFRKGGMSLEDAGLWLMQNGWVRANDTGNGIPTEAEVIDLIDRALREKMYHPEEGAAAMEADRAKLQANDGEWQDRADAIRGDVERINANNPDNFPLKLTDDDVAAIVPTLPDHATIEDAIFAHWDAMAREAEIEAAAVGEDAGFDDYADDVPFGGEDNGSAIDQAGQDSGGSAAAAGDAREGGAGIGGAESEAFTGAAAEQALEAFDAPHGEGPTAQVESLWHDLKAEVEAMDHLALSEAAAAAAAPDRFAIVNGKIKTLTGREIPVPKPIRLGAGDRAVANDVRALSQWLIDQARSEAQARGDDFNGPAFDRMEAKRLSDGDKSVLNEYLFGDPDPTFRVMEAAPAMEARPAEAAAMDVMTPAEREKYKGLITRHPGRDGKPATTKQVVEQGWNAANYGFELADDPYYATSSNSTAWRKGWNSAAPEERGSRLRTDRAAAEARRAPVASITEGAGPVGDTATGSLGLDAAQEAPAGGMTERQRAEMATRLQQSQMRRGGQQSADQISGGLFDAARDQLDAFAMPDGSTVSKADLLAEFDADDAAIKTIRDCL